MVLLEISCNLSYISGWGQYKVGKSGPPSSILKQAQLEIVSQQSCTDLNTRHLGIPITNKMVCGGWHDNEIDSGCHGDSGGPFVCKNALGVWELQGAVSWGSGVCDAKQAYTVFSNVFKFKPWIEQFTSEEYDE